MAYSCVKVLFEIGHEASIRNKRTPEGFTHDWEVFVRGVENSDIFHFVEKVVFHLHETFPKPKRVVKEPPYSVKESGYAGFNLPIDIYFKNSDEPKKVRFNYDLHLQNTGPPISKVLREQYVFPNPAEDLRRRLIKGGGVGVLGSESGFHLAQSEKLPPPTSDEALSHKHPVQGLVGKPKLSGNDSGKKHKVKEGKGDESRVSNSFHDLFGPPIKTAKVSPDPKKSSSSSHSSPKVSPASKSTKSNDKSSSDKSEKSSKSSKHASQREGKESGERNSSSSGSREEKKEKDKSRDKEKNKDKPPKRPSTPVKPASTPPKRPSSPPKRPPSPPKRPSSPTKLLAPPAPSKTSGSPKHLQTTKPIKEEPKKSNSEDSKSKNESKSGESNKSEKKKKDKKNKDEKPKKDKHKDHEKSSDKAVKNEKSKDLKDKDVNKKLEKETIKEPEKAREKEKDKSKHGDGDKEKQRHKHKKKDKSNKDKEREKERDKDKSSKKSSESKITDLRDKEKNGLTNDSSRGSADTTSDISAPHKKQAASSPSPSPVRVASPMKPSPTPEKSVSSVPTKDKIKHPMVSDDSSDSHSSALSGDEDVGPPVSRIKPVKTPESAHVPVENKTCVLAVTEPPRPNSRSEVVKPKSENSSQERNSLNKSSSKQKEKSSKKNKERESGSLEGEKLEKDSKKKRKRSNRILEDGECTRNNGEAPTPKIPKLELESEELPLDPEPLEEKAAVEEIKEESDPEEPPLPPPAHLTEEYVSQLRELQHKIMTLEDNAELQRVVQVIAETGQYEITKKTFDFDLCALDRNTVERLQELFAPS